VKRSNEASSRGKNMPGVQVAFPYDRITVEHFRQMFPRARWSDKQQSWFIPGKTAARRFDHWRAREIDQIGLYADVKGRDAYEFDPIVSPYLEVAQDLRVRTPYSRTVIEELRNIPWAHWDDELHVWRIPFRSYEDMQRRWQVIEAAARRNEPEVKKRRKEEERDNPARQAAIRRSTERRRRRYPLPAQYLPPLERPVSTTSYGVVVFMEVSGEVAENPELAEYYPHVPAIGDPYIWGLWRPASLSELIATWPARTDPAEETQVCGWWQPTLEELRSARRQARSVERRKQRIIPPEL
jgi:hypothetical protein